MGSIHPLQIANALRAFENSISASGATDLSIGFRASLMPGLGKVCIERIDVEIDGNLLKNFENTLTEIQRNSE